MERGSRAPGERYRLLYLKIFQDMAGDLWPGIAYGAEFALRLAEVRSRAARLAGRPWAGSAPRPWLGVSRPACARV
jgi:hypothetical protein